MQGECEAQQGHPEVSQATMHCATQLAQLTALLCTAACVGECVQHLLKHACLNLQQLQLCMPGFVSLC